MGLRATHDPHCKLTLQLLNALIFGKDFLLIGLALFVLGFQGLLPSVIIVGDDLLVEVRKLQHCLHDLIGKPGIILKIVN